MRALWILLLSPAIAACGSPGVPMPSGMEVVYLALDGQSGVPRSVQPMAVLSDEVDPASLAQGVVLLHAEYEWAASDGGAAHLRCGTREGRGFGKETITAAVTGTDRRTVTVTPNASLQPDRCYRLVLTTALKGTSQGNLKDPNLSVVMQDAAGNALVTQPIGAFSQFLTAAD